MKVKATAPLQLLCGCISLGYERKTYALLSRSNISFDFLALILLVYIKGYFSWERIAGLLSVI
jgi:hypothetical protein